MRIDGDVRSLSGRALLALAVVALLPACLPVREGPYGLIGSEQLSLAGDDARLAVLHDRRAAVCDGGGSLLLVDLAMDDRRHGLHVVDLERRMDGSDEQRAIAPQVAASPEGHLVAVSVGDVHVHLVTPFLAQVTGRLPVRRRAPLRAPITALAFDATGELLATGHEDGALSIWEVAGELVAALEPGAVQGPVRAVSVVQGTSVLAVGARGEVVRWSPGRPLPEQVLTPAEGVGEAALRGNLLARVVGDAVEVRACTPGSDEVWSFSPGLVPPLRIAIGPGGRRLVVAGAAPPGGKAPVQVWRRGEPRPEHSFDGHRQGVCAVAFGANGRRVFSLGLDGRVRAWDLDY